MHLEIDAKFYERFFVCGRNRRAKVCHAKSINVKHLSHKISTVNYADFSLLRM